VAFLFPESVNTPAMLVFIDESGDPGFELDRGASPVFVAAMVMFQTDEAAAATQAAIEQSEARRVHKSREFKFNKCRNDVRDLFFQAVQGCDFSLRAIVVRKAVIYSKVLKSDKERFYGFFVRQMMKHDGGTLRNAKVIIDRSGDQAFRRDLGATLRSGAGGIKSVKFKNSESDVLVQLADMCAGAIARSYRTDRRYNSRWRCMIEKRIDDVWDFR
jgi:hypothetical protein